MLHRTQAKQVLPVYEEFVRQYRDIASLALASKKGLRRTLYSLGLQWRIDLIHRMAQELDTRFSGQVPRDKDALLSLPGVSEYIAAAVRCFAWNEPEAIIDTNTVRVIGRVFGLEIKPSSRRNPQFRTILKKLVDPKHPKLYNYALLDLADKVCTIKRPPDCPQCPLVQMCIYGKAMM